MAEIVWTERALAQLDEIAGYIALDKPVAAKRVVRRVFDYTDRLAAWPGLGKILPQLRRSAYRQLWISPCWVYYRVAETRVFILHVRRAEKPFRIEDLTLG